MKAETFIKKGDIRRAITGSFISVYFVVICFLIFRGIETIDTELVKIILGHFTYLVGIIIVVYFGSSGVREYLKYQERKQNSRK